MEVTETIERRFLLEQLPNNLDECECINIEQAYLAINPEVRLKKANGECSFTIRERNGLIKKDTKHLVLEESFNELFKNIHSNVIKKKRYHMELTEDIPVVLDVYQEEFEGLNIIKVKFNNKFDAMNFRIPLWFGKEVTDDELYKSKYLATVDYEEVKVKRYI